MVPSRGARCQSSRLIRIVPWRRWKFQRPTIPQPLGGGRPSPWACAATLPYISRVVVYGDSTSALLTAIDPSPHPVQSQSILLNQALRKWLNNIIAFKWCPWQNDRADYLAKRAFTLHNTAPTVTISYAKMRVVKGVMGSWTHTIALSLRMLVATF